MNNERRRRLLRIAVLISALFLVTLSVLGSLVLTRWCVTSRCVVPLNESNAQNFADRGRMLIARGDYSEGETVLRRTLAFDPKNVSALQELAGQLRHRGNYAESEALFLRAIALRPDDALLYVDIGKLYRNMNDADQALAMFKRAEAIDATQPRLWTYGYAELYNTLGEFDKAIAAVERAVSLDPHDHYTYMSLGNIYREQKKYEQAITAYMRSLNEHPRSEASFGLGYTYIQMGNLDEAEFWFRNYTEVFDSPRGEVYAGLGTIAAKRGAYRDALWYYAYASYLDPHTVPGNPIDHVLHKIGETSKWQRLIGGLTVMLVRDTAFMFNWLGIR